MPTIADVQCKSLFSECGNLPEADDCYVEGFVDAKRYKTCNSKLPALVSAFTSSSMADKQEYMLAGLAGGVTQKYTCATAMRYLYLESNECPMPLPPKQPDLTAGATFSLFGIGDWGPTVLGYTAAGPTGCDCGNGKLCHASVFEHKAQFSNEGGVCQSEGTHAAWYNNSQQEVANSMARLAQDKSPVAVLNVGDNFYLGGLAGPWVNTNSPSVAPAVGFTMVTSQQAFNDTWSKVYLENQFDTGKKLHVPWLSVMGNHDYGGEGCLADWQGQIEFTKVDPKGVWSMPWQWHKRRVQADGYFVDIFMTEANVDDAADGPDSICEQSKCLGGSASYKADVDKCKARYKAWDAADLAWLTNQLRISRGQGSRWQIIVGHFSDPSQMGSAKRQALMGPNALYIGGHTHKQDFWPSSTGHTIICTGGGGGYDLDNPTHGWGWTMIEISKDKIDVSLIRADRGDSPDQTRTIQHTDVTTVATDESVEAYV
jgi:hypothetical protein